MMHLSINVSGLVQGVGFRYSVLRVALEMGVVGTVKNEMDGSVSIEAQADERVLHIFLSKMKASPAPFGRVDNMDYNFSNDLKSYKKFTVIG
ncbi:acylphosphatase [Companilactobacillus allii]|uniref:acylphosphatase n=2 Tax=Companilactobacillus allii TaxID=1847728 RepID=A0A1P8Q3X9_9LACO|nr:acylphosphatase [Companilactobacillus allii]APX72551.1 acylphosphatase [Companilactobacillus allii]